MKHFIFSLVLFSFASVSALEVEDSKAIYHIIEEISSAWNDFEGQGFANDYASDAAFVNIFGVMFNGKKEIEERHVKILQNFLKGSFFEVIDIKLREPKPDVVIAHVQWKVTGIPKSDKSPLHDTWNGIFTHLLIKNEGKWEIAASQNTLISK